MRVGLIASFATHTILIGLGIVTISNSKPHVPEEIQSIAVDLVPIADFSNIRVGTEQSDIIETKIPSPVETEEVATISERAGSTEQDQPNPEETNIATPAPTIQSAPQPEARPEIEPEIKPEPEPEPEVPDPILSAEPDQTSEPTEVAPRPIVRTALIDKKREEYKRQQEELEKRKEQEAKQADRVSDIINAEESRGATTGVGGQASAGKPTGQAALLTRSERDGLAAAMRKCWNPPLSALSEEGLTIRLLVNMNRDGSVAGTPKILSKINSSIASATAKAAQRAVLRCSPYKLSNQKYQDWKQIDVTFDPKDVL